MHRRVVALLLAPLLLLAVGLTRTAAAQDAPASSFVAKTNGERQARGLRPYVVKADLARVAARHSQRMADRNSLHHNPNLGSEVQGWQIVGENVGSGGSVDAIHTAFMNSTKHRNNILARDYTEIGVATVTDSRGVIWVTQVFRLPYRAPKAKPPVRQVIPPTVVRVVVQPRRPVAQPRPVTKPVVAAPKAAAPVPVPVVDRPAAAAFATALAPARTATTAVDPFALATAYATTMGALNR